MPRATIVSPVPEPDPRDYYTLEPAGLDDIVHQERITVDGSPLAVPLEEFEVTEEVADSTDRIDDACEQLDGRAESIRAEQS